ncbi:MAG: hypothetical protein HW391_951 [Chloroflexi bacterium]|nr:hypothetical protein [Chloroflexota bacterium]
MTTPNPRRTSARGRWPALVAGSLVIVLIGCATTPSPFAPSPPAWPTASPAPSPSAGGGCPVKEQTGALRSNTLIDLAITSDGVSDLVTFRFGDVAPGPTGGAGRLSAVRPPILEGGSGLPVEVVGSHFVEVHFDGMLIANEAGEAVFVGPTSAKPSMLALRQVEMTEAFEGVYNFVLGYDGNGCVTLVEDAATKTLTVAIGH